MPVRRRSRPQRGSSSGATAVGTVVLGMGYPSHHNNNHHHSRSHPHHAAAVSSSFRRRSSSRRHHTIGSNTRQGHRHHHHHQQVTAGRGVTHTRATVGKENINNVNSTIGHQGVNIAAVSARTATGMKQEVSVCLRSMSPGHQGATMSRSANESQLPLRVVLPPEKVSDNKSSRLLTLDKDCNKKINDSSETTDDNNKTLNVEEFECGVSVAGSDKQEWSFTLYDFDGKGKVTKEDLGSLLRSLYDAVGSSINLPKSGSKTLKLRLTVSPDNTKVTGSGNATSSGATSRPSPTGDNSNSSSRDTNKNNKTKESKLNKDLDNSKLSGKELKLDNINNAAEQLNLLESCAGAALLEAAHQQQHKVHHKEVKNNLSNPGAKPAAGKPKLTTMEQRHLAELVQKNMERHQQRQQQRHQRTRRHKPHSFNAGALTSSAGKNAAAAAVVDNNNRVSMIHTCEESRDRRNYYLDLAGIENDDPSKLLHNTSAPAELLALRGGASGAVGHGGKRERDPHRSRDGKLRARSSHNARERRQQHHTSKAVAANGNAASGVGVVVDNGGCTAVNVTGGGGANHHHHQHQHHQRSRSYDNHHNQTSHGPVHPVEHHCCSLTEEEEHAAEMAAHRTRLVERSVEEKVEKCKNLGSLLTGTPTATTTTTSPTSPVGVVSPTSATSPESPSAAILKSPNSTSTPNKNHSKHGNARPVSLPPTNMPDTVSPHHHRRHRNRDRNRKLAMQQVAEWIEREHAWNAAAAAVANADKNGAPGGAAAAAVATAAGLLAGGVIGTGNGAAGGGGGGSCPNAATPGGSSSDQQKHVVVQRHEHHHVHEHHHHHHYHHYHET